MFALVRERGSSRLRRVRKKLGIGEATNPSGTRHCLIDVVTSIKYFSDWCDRIASVQKYVIEEIVEDAKIGGLTDNDVKEAISFLTFRQSNMRKIIIENRDEFAVRAWSEWL